MSKSAQAFRTISEVATDLEIPKHVLRFWEAKFPQIRPMKRGGGRRYYRPEDMELLRGIRRLLHTEGYTIKGVQKILRDQGSEHVKTYSTLVPFSGKSRKSSKLNGNGSELTAFIGPRITTALPADTLKKSLPSINSDQHKVSKVLREAIAELETCKKLLLGEVSAGEGSTLQAPSSLRHNRG
ncbi:MAG: MerR family transcriptional regulator [Hyphomicrobium sp.]